MALTLETNARNALADALDALINTGGAGTLLFETAADAEVATITFDATAFGAAANGTITMASPPKEDASATGGTIDHFAIYNGSAAKVLEGTVTATGGGGDIEISSLVIAASERVELTTFTITVPAS